MKSGGIQSRVMLIALLPALILALSLTIFHARNRMVEIEEAVLAKGRAVARHLAPGSEFGVVTGNFSLLESIGNSAMQDEDFVRIVISDKDGNAILDRRRQPSLAGKRDWIAGAANLLHPLFSSNELIVPIRAPIHRIRIELADDFSTGDSEPALPQIVGWIDIDLSLLSASRNQFIVLMESFMIVLGALLASAAAGRYVGRGVVTPIRAMTNTVRRISEGHLKARSDASASGELAQLQTGINQLAEQVEVSQQRLQAEVDKATTDLKSTMAELERRNLELDDARLEAERVSDFKSQFLANVSHEIRTPMNAILGFTELLTRSNTDPVQKEFLETILSSASSLLTLLNEILDLSRIESGNMELDPIDTDIGRIINEVYQLFLPQAIDKNLEFFARNIEPDLAWVQVDPMRLKQVLVNLVSNALKFTDDGYVLLRTTVESAGANRLDIRFSVEDTGCGIAEATQRKLFRAFSQGDMSSTRSHGGSGLGLHIASELVFMMGGEISVESAPGLGSTFSFNLSLERVEAQQPAVPATEDQVLDFDFSRPILLTNAYMPFARILRETLHRGGFEVATPDDDDFKIKEDWACVLDYRTSRAEPRIDHDEMIEALSRTRQVRVLAWVGGVISDVRPQDRAWEYHAYISRTPDPRHTRRALIKSLSLPAARTADAAAGPASHVVESRRSRILVVDDHPLNLKLVQSLLENTGYEAHCMLRAPEALELARKSIFDAILLDIHMPHLDGFAMARALREKDSVCRDSIIIAVTADAYAETAQQASQSGMNDILVKPISQDSLLAMLDTWLEPGPAEEKPPTPDTTGANLNRLDRSDALTLEMREALRKMLPAHRAQLQAAYQAARWGELREQVHHLRGATSYCGVPRLTDALARLESHLDRPIDEQDPAGLPAGLYERCITLIDAEIRGEPAP